MQKNVRVGHVVAINPKDLTKDEFVRWVRGDDPTLRILDLVNGASVRDLVLESAGLVEQVLTELLAATVDALRPARGFVPFAEKIKRAFDAGLINDELRRQLDLLKEIRKPFAHDPNLFRFEHDDKVVAYCKALQFRGDLLPVFDLRDRYAFAAVGCVIALRDLLSAASARKAS